MSSDDPRWHYETGFIEGVRMAMAMLSGQHRTEYERITTAPRRRFGFLRAEQRDGSSRACTVIAHTHGHLANAAAASIDRRRKLARDDGA